MKILTCGDLVKRLVDARIVPPNCRHIVIDIELTNAVKLYYETYADDRLLKVFAEADIKVEGAQ